MNRLPCGVFRLEPYVGSAGVHETMVEKDRLVVRRGTGLGRHDGNFGFGIERLR